VALAVLCLVGTLIWQFPLPGRGVFTPASASCANVRTEPLPPSAIVRTQPFAAERIVVSVASVDVVHTTPSSGRFRKIDDDELLALVARPEPARLVGVNPCAAVGAWIGPAQLVTALVATGLAGGVLALVWASCHGRLSESLDRLKETVKKRSFGVIGGPVGGVGEGMRTRIRAIVMRSAIIPTTFFQIMLIFYCNRQGIIFRLVTGWNGKERTIDHSRSWTD